MSITTENESSELVFKDTSLFGMFFFLFMEAWKGKFNCQKIILKAIHFHCWPQNHFKIYLKNFSLSCN